MIESAIKLHRKLKDLEKERDKIDHEIRITKQELANSCPIKAGQVVAKDGVSVVVSRVEMVGYRDVVHHKLGIPPDDVDEEEIVKSIIWRTIGIPIWPDERIDYSHKQPVAITVFYPVDIETGKVIVS